MGLVNRLIFFCNNLLDQTKGDASGQQSLTEKFTCQIHFLFGKKRVLRNGTQKVVFERNRGGCIRVDK